MVSVVVARGMDTYKGINHDWKKSHHLHFATGPWKPVQGATGNDGFLVGLAPSPIEIANRLKASSDDGWIATRNPGLGNDGHKTKDAVHGDRKRPTISISDNENVVVASDGSSPMVGINNIFYPLPDTHSGFSTKLVNQADSLHKLVKHADSVHKLTSHAGSSPMPINQAGFPSKLTYNDGSSFILNEDIGHKVASGNGDSFVLGSTSITVINKEEIDGHYDPEFTNDYYNDILSDSNQAEEVRLKAESEGAIDLLDLVSNLKAQKGDSVDLRTLSNGKSNEKKRENLSATMKPQTTFPKITTELVRTLSSLSPSTTTESPIGASSIRRTSPPMAIPIPSSINAIKTNLRLPPKRIPITATTSGVTAKFSPKIVDRDLLDNSFFPSEPSVSRLSTMLDKHLKMKKVKTKKKRRMDHMSKNLVEDKEYQTAQSLKKKLFGSIVSKNTSDIHLYIHTCTVYTRTYLLCFQNLEYSIFPNDEKRISNFLNRHRKGKMLSQRPPKLQDLASGKKMSLKDLERLFARVAKTHKKIK